MNLKTILLLGSLAFMGNTTPTTNYQPVPNVRSDANSLSDGTASLTARGGYGVWLDVYHSGDCNSGYEAQPTSGWVWEGQCKRLDSYTYGAKLGYAQGGWPRCKLKFWETTNCAGGRATAIRIPTTSDGNFNCIAAANKGDEFYLTNGASSVQLLCDDIPPTTAAKP
ncbi:hypothetical protein BJX68DRAFT_270819 [Aspergillus pseudodeflectus]|uniref:Uncharacterized protein n=1 Tax=Aspergillus pseudodeflectus TaxID=176178 RepID=A0ABR4JPY9_9EURO